VDKNGFWYLNGKRIFLRGTNYISSHWLSEMTKARFLKDLKMMKEANINIVRVHAHIEPEIFYQLADEIGIMIWQDFALQWGYSDDEEFRTEAVKQAKENLRINKVRYEQQVATSTDVIDAQTLLLRTEVNLAVAKIDYLSALAALERAVGSSITEVTK
jgi:beta-galactosidase GanA